MVSPKPLTEEERRVYEWQMWVPDFGEAGQEKLKGTSVLISRVGGLGSVVAYELAAAGIGRMVLAHGGVVKPSDLNRQLLMTHGWIGKKRIETVTRRLRELNPRLDIIAVDQNISEDNAQELTEQADIIVDCAPLFEERFAMNRQSVLQNKPLVECAMYDMEAQITLMIPGQTPCLHCLYPEPPSIWKREFPVFGAISGTVGCLGAVEVIKWASGIGTSLAGTLLTINLRDMVFRKIHIQRRPDCPTCPGS